MVRLMTGLAVFELAVFEPEVPSQVGVPHDVSLLIFAAGAVTGFAGHAGLRPLGVRRMTGQTQRVGSVLCRQALIGSGVRMTLPLRMLGAVTGRTSLGADGGRLTR